MTQLANQGRREATEARVRAFWQDAELAGPGSRVCAAVSGGADSVALLLILHRLAGQLGIRLSACHINHCLRGEAAARDEALVRGLCGALGVPLQVFNAAARGPVPPHPGEDWARRLRYACFAELLAGGIDLVATAHTVSDQAETLLFRLARGTGLRGAAGIRPCRAGYIRPLLCLARADTEAYCRAAGAAWAEDETNFADSYARNRLRHHALPALRSVNSAAEQNLALFCERAARADAYLTALAKQLLAAARTGGAAAAWLPLWRLDVLQKADPPVLETAARLLADTAPDPDEPTVQRVCALVRAGSGAVQLAPDVRLAAASGLLRLEKGGLPCAPYCLPFAPRAYGIYRLPGGFALRCAVYAAPQPEKAEKTQLVHKKDLKNLADYAKIAVLYPALCLRTRRPGDRFRPAGRGVSKELRRFMNEMALPPPLRGSWPLLAQGSEVLWMYGFGFAQGLAPTGEARVLLRLEPVCNREDVEP